MKSEIRKTLIQKLNDALITEVPELTRREIRLPAVPGKAIAVIGMRRSGKTCFLSQCMADLLAEGTPRESLLLMNFEDDRLAGMDATDLSFLLECYYQRHPELRDKARVTLFLDELALAPTPPSGECSSPVQHSKVSQCLKISRPSGVQGQSACVSRLFRGCVPHSHNLNLHGVGASANGQSPQGLPDRSGVHFRL